MKVWLVYEDDYGGTFSPYWLSKVFENEDELKVYTKTLTAGLYSVVTSEHKGLDKKAYKPCIGGLFSDD